MFVNKNLFYFIKTKQNNRSYTKKKDRCQRNVKKKKKGYDRN